MTDAAPDIRRSELILVILGITAMLILRVWLQRYYVQAGLDASLAKHVSFLVALPLFVVIALPALLRQRALLVRIFRWQHSSWGMLWRGILIGILCRALWWAFVTVRALLGFAESTGNFPSLLWSFSCPPTGVLLVGIFTMAIVTPFYEELAHRGIIQTYFAGHGVVAGILASALIFTVFHTPVVNPTVFAMGIILAIQFHLTRSMWMPVATHGTYNGIIQLDWVCLKLQWDPRPDDLPSIGPSILLLVGSCLALSMIYLLLRNARREAPTSPPG